MEACLHQTPKLVLIAMTEESQTVYGICILGVLALQILNIDSVIEPVNKRTNESPLVKQVELLWRGVDEIGVARV